MILKHKFNDWFSIGLVFLQAVLIMKIELHFSNPHFGLALIEGGITLKNESIMSA